MGCGESKAKNRISSTSTLTCNLVAHPQNPERCPMGSSTLSGRKDHRTKHEQATWHHPSITHPGPSSDTVTPAPTDWQAEKPINTERKENLQNGIMDNETPTGDSNGRICAPVTDSSWCADSKHADSSVADSNYLPGDELRERSWRMQTRTRVLWMRNRNAEQNHRRTPKTTQGCHVPCSRLCVEL